MTSYFKTTEINTALSNISSKLSEKASVANLYPVLKKATSSSEEATPGYVFEVVEHQVLMVQHCDPVLKVLIESSYESSDNSRHLVEYLNKRLCRPAPHGVLKTLKTIKHLVERGSREFRKILRECDEHIKTAADYANHNSAFTGGNFIIIIIIIVLQVLRCWTRFAG